MARRFVRTAITALLILQGEGLLPLAPKEVRAQEPCRSRFSRLLQEPRRVRDAVCSTYRKKLSDPVSNQIRAWLERNRHEVDWNRAEAFYRVQCLAVGPALMQGANVLYMKSKHGEFGDWMEKHSSNALEGFAFMWMTDACLTMQAPQSRKAFLKLTLSAHAAAALFFEVGPIKNSAVQTDRASTDWGDLAASVEASAAYWMAIQAVERLFGLDFRKDCSR